ncbi:MAG: AAA family ATPase [Crocinitomicaceae bacterium]
MKLKNSINSDLDFNNNPHPEIVFPNKIFGRLQAQIDLQSALDEFKKGQTCSLVVKGNAGIGKSFIVRSFFKNIEDCDFYSGKFLQFRRGIPFLAFRQIFEAVIGAQKRRAADKERWKAEFIDRFDPYLSELSLVIPALSELIEIEVTNPKAASPIETRNKINSAFSDFIVYMLEKSENKIILHYDDLQWADKDSLNFLEYLIAKNHPNLLVILSNRPTEKALLAKELVEFYQRIEESISLKKIQLEALSLPALKELLKVVFPFSNSNYDQLSKLSLDNSNGNPYVLHEFLSSLSRLKYLKYNAELNNWSWEFQDNSSISFEHNLPRLLIDRLENLGEMQRLVIQSCACFGANLNVPFISRITGFEQDTIQETFREAMKIGFIIPLEVKYEEDLSDLNNFKFTNETIQDAVHESFVESQRFKIHKKIANYFIENSMIGLDSRDVFECAYHLNEAIHEESDFQEKLIHAEVNLKAAEKALSTASFSLALNYLQQAMDSNLHHNWESAYSLASNVRIKGYQIARITNNVSLANKLYSQGSENCKGIDLSELRFAKVSMDIQFGELQAALDTGIVALEELGVKVPAKAGVLNVVKELIKTKIMLFRKSPEKIFQLPELSDEKVEFAIKLMIWMFKSAYYLNPELNAVLSLRILQLTLKKGTCADSASGLMAYGIIAAAGSNNFKKAYEYCNVGALLADKYKEDSCRHYFGQAVYKAYKFPLRDTLDLYRLAVEKGYEDGDFLGSAEPTVNESLTYFSAGYDLNTVEEKVKQSAIYCQDLKVKDYYDFQTMLLYQLKILKGEMVTADEELQLKEILNTTEYNLTITTYNFLKLQQYCFEGDWEKAYQQSQNLKKEVPSMTGIYLQVEYYFYRAMVVLKNIKNTSGIQRIKDRREVNSIIKKMEKWGESAPSNHQHKMHIISGLYEEMKGEDLEAKHHYINAANLANEAKFIQNAALAYYFLAELSNKKKDEKNATHYRDKSAAFFKEWGTTLIS